MNKALAAKVFPLWLCVLGFQCACQQAPTAFGQNTDWMTFEKCPAIAEHEVEVPAQEQGVLESIKVQESQAVEAGQTLAVLDQEEAELQLGNVQLQYEEAQAVAADNSELQFRQNALQQKRKDLDNVRSIRNSVNQSELDRLQLDVEAAQTAVNALLKKKETAARDVKRMQYAVRLAKIRLERRQIKTPLRGNVLEILVEPGEWVEVGEPIMKIHNLETMLVDRMLPIGEWDLSALAGTEVRADVARPDGSLVRLSGEIFAYDQHVVSGGLVRAHARLKNIKQGDDWVLIPGQEVVLHVAAPSKYVASQARASVTPSRKVH